MEGAFQDSVIDKAEAKAIGEALKEKLSMIGT